MPGFLIHNLQMNKDYLPCDLGEKDRVIESFQYGKYQFSRNTLNKYMEDKVFFDDEEWSVILEGVLLNKKQLLKKYGVTSMRELLLHYLNKNISCFWSEFRGMFTGAFYNKKKDQLTSFVSPIGDKPLFYCKIMVSGGGQSIIISSSVNWLIDLLKENHLPYDLDETAVYYSLTYGFMVDDRTLVKQIKRLTAGNYLVVEPDAVFVKQYHRFHFDKEERSLSEQEIITLVDEKFNHAIEMEYEKDREYGLKHFASLSGGLDSRMNVWTAYELGYKDILTFCFGQTNCLDEKIAKQVAKKLELEFIFVALDYGKFIKDIDEITEKEFGLIDYTGACHGYRNSKYINTDYGLSHSGQIGDAVIGTDIKENSHNVKPGGVHCPILLERLPKDHLRAYKNQEEHFFYGRAFHGAAGTHCVGAHELETVSPFLDIDFLEFCFKIPRTLRYNHYIYKKWILAKHPQAAQFKWEATNSKISDSQVHILCNKVRRAGLQRAMIVMLRKLGMKGIDKQKRYQGMNPFDLWYDEKAWLREFIDRYFKDHIDHKKIDQQLKADLMRMYAQGTTLNKLQLLGALSAIHLYFD